MTKDQLKKLATQYDEAKQNFLYYWKPEFDRAYKLFASYTGDRAKRLEKDEKTGEIWQSNVFIPQVFSYIKTFLQKTVGVAPDFNLEGKNAEPLKETIEWLWKVGMSKDMIDYFLQVFITGITVGKDFLKRERQKERIKEIGFIENIVEKVKQLLVKTKEKGVVFRPDFDPVDIYNFYFHPRAKKQSDPFPKFHRYVKTIDEYKLQYPEVPASVWAQFEDKEGGDTKDYAYVRKEVLIETYKSIKEYTTSSAPYSTGQGQGSQEEPKSDEKLFELVEAWDQSKDQFTVFAPMGGNPIEVKSGPIPFDHGEDPYEITIFFPRLFQIYGMGIPKMIEHLQELLNSGANQRNDSVTLSIHGLIAAAPTSLPGYKSSDFKFGPNRILWTNDPRSVQHIRQGEVPQSAYLEEDKIKEAMRIAVGVDDFSTAKGMDRKETATVASFMREATLEGVKLFLIMLKSSYQGHFEHYISMIKQYWTRRSVVPKKALAILDDYADLDFPVTDENWIDEDGNHRLFPDEYELDIEQASQLATSKELAKTKDKELWETIKDLPDDMIDPETGEVYSIKKFKILMKIIEDYGWDKDEYVVKKKIEEAPINPEMAVNPEIPQEVNNENINNNPSLVGNQTGAEFGAAMR